jgi:oligo-1,6-glucosidase
MQWNSQPNAGFTTGTPWLPVNNNYLEINAEKALKDPDSVFHYYKKLIALRHTHDIIVYGEFIPLLENDANVYAYRRALDGKELTVLCNWTDKTVPCVLSTDKMGEELISNYPEHKEGFLYPYEARVMLK